MWECPYGKEPFDSRLFCLRFLRKIWIVILSGILGAAIIGGCYFLNKVVLADETEYEATSLYYVSYGTDPLTDNTFTYINAYTWNLWTHTDGFLEDTMERLNEVFQGTTDYLPGSLTKDTLSSYITADLPSDLCMPTTKVVTKDPELTILIDQVVNETFIQLAEEHEKILQAKVVDRQEHATSVIDDVRTFRAAVLGGILALFFSCLVLTIYLVWDDSIYVSATFEYRFHIPMLGMLPMNTTENQLYIQLKEQLVQHFASAYKLAIISSEEQQATTKVVDLCKKLGIESATEMPNLLLCPEIAQTLREYDGVLLVVESGTHNGKKIEYLLGQLKHQGVAVTAAILCNADEGLFKQYYELNRGIR